MMNDVNIRRKELATEGQNKDVVSGVRWVRYTILDPSGNITVLVVDETIDVKDVALRKKINDAILQANPEVEQVGFLTSADIKIDGKKQKVWKIQMAGDEFCGNASRAFACYLVENELVERLNFPMMCSGNDNILLAKVEKRGDRKYYSNVDIPINKNIRDFVSTKQIYKVVLKDIDIFPETSAGIIRQKANERANIEAIKLDGIVHILVDMNTFPMESEIKCKRIAREVIRELGLQNEPAVGVIWSDFETNTINPFVWVKGVDTIYYENACGSGSLAYGIKKSIMQDEKNISVLQKNGKIIDVNVINDGDVIEKVGIGGETLIGANKYIDADNKRSFSEISNTSYDGKDGCRHQVVVMSNNLNLGVVSCEQKESNGVS